MINPHAFPSPGVVIDYDSNQHQQGAYEGMSLRDYFAGKAMQALLTRLNSGPGNAAAAQRMTRESAEYAYATADAMLAERAK